MLDKLKQLGKESLIYGLSRVIGRFISLFFVPIYTRIFTPSDYGIVDLIGTLSAIIGTLMVMGLDAAQAYYFYSTDDIKDKRQTLSTSFFFQLGISSLMLIILFVSSYGVSRLIFGESSYALYFQLVALDLPFICIINFTQDLLRLIRQPWKYTYFITGNIISNVILTILMVAVWRKGIYGIYVSKLTIDFLSSVAAIYLIKPNISNVLSLNKLKNLLFYGVPLIPASVVYWLINASNRFFMKYYISLDKVGIYSVGNKIATILGLVTVAFQLAWIPFSMSIHRDEDSKLVYANTLTYYLVITSGIAILLSIFSPEALKILTTEAYYEASIVVPYLVFGLIGNGVYYIVNVGVNVTKKTVHIGWTTGFAAVCNVSLNFLLIPRFGLVGAALANMVSFWVSAILLFFISQHYYPIPFNLGDALIILGSSIILIIAGCNIPISSPFFLILAKIGLIIIYLLILIVTPIPKPSIIQKIIKKII